MWLRESIPQEFRNPDKVKQLLADAMDAVQQSAECAPPMPDISETTLSTLYAFAYRFYRDGQFGKAADFFRFLCLVGMDKKKHWIGLGAAEQLLENYDEALQAYAMAAMTDPSDPFPHFHAAECYLKQLEVDEAHLALDCAERNARGTPRYENLQTHIHLIRSRWPQEKELRR